MLFRSNPELSDAIDHDVDALVEYDVWIAEKNQIAPYLMEKQINSFRKTDVQLGIVVKEELNRLTDFSDASFQGRHVLF